MLRIISKDEYDKLKANMDSEESKKMFANINWFDNGSEIKYHVYDASLVNGHFEEVLWNQVYQTFEDYLKTEWVDEYDKDVGDYGHWRLDFTDEISYFNTSWLTLKELNDADYTKYKSEKYKIDKKFYDAFKSAGGVLPVNFTVNEEYPLGDIVDVYRESLHPTVLISWPMKEAQAKKCPLICGIDELKKIAEIYKIENPEDIRIVFTFDG